MMDFRHPHLILGVDFGVTAEEATRAFAKKARRARRDPDAPFDLEDLTWALNQIEHGEGDAADDLVHLRVPADPDAYAHDERPLPGVEPLDRLATHDPTLVEALRERVAIADHVEAAAAVLSSTRPPLSGDEETLLPAIDQIENAREAEAARMRHVRARLIQQEGEAWKLIWQYDENRSAASTARLLRAARAEIRSALDERRSPDEVEVPPTAAWLAKLPDSEIEVAAARHHQACAAIRGARRTSNPLRRRRFIQAGITFAVGLLLIAIEIVFATELGQRERSNVFGVPGAVLLIGSFVLLHRARGTSKFLADEQIKGTVDYSIIDDPPSPSNSTMRWGASGLVVASLVVLLIVWADPFGRDSATTVSAPDSSAQPSPAASLDADESPRPETDPPPDPVPQPVFSLETGDCFLLPNAQDDLPVGELPVIQCLHPHDEEVFHVFNLTGESFPGEQTVQARADDECVSAFESFVQVDISNSELDVAWITPTREAWSAGIRKVICTLYDKSDQALVGSMRNSGR